MPRQTRLRDHAREWIARLPVDTVFTNVELYDFLAQNYPRECRARGDAKNEPRFHTDARWAIQDSRTAASCTISSHRTIRGSVAPSSN
jgi:hypothetical protein